MILGHQSFWTSTSGPNRSITQWSSRPLVNNPASRPLPNTPCLHASARAPIRPPQRQRHTRNAQRRRNRPHRQSRPRPSHRHPQTSHPRRTSSPSSRAIPTDTMSASMGPTRIPGLLTARRMRTLRTTQTMMTTTRRQRHPSEVSLARQDGGRRQRRLRGSGPLRRRVNPRRQRRLSKRTRASCEHPAPTTTL